MKFDLDLLRSRHVLLGMFLGYVLGSPRLSLTFPVNGPSNGSKTGITTFFSAQSVRRAPHWCPHLTSEASASAHQPCTATLLCP